MRKWLKCLLAGSAWGVFRMLGYLSAGQEIYLSDVIFKLSLGRIAIYRAQILDMVYLVFPLFMFQILFGTSLYSHFCSASVYYFSRCNDRIRWFMGDALKLLPLALLYGATMAAAGTVTAFSSCQVIFDSGSLILLLYYLVVYTLWLYLTALAVNLLAIRWGSSAGFGIVAAFQGLLLVLLFWQSVFYERDPLYLTSVRNRLLLQLNPLAHLVLSWHSSDIVSIKDRINVLNISFDLNITVVLFIVLGALVTLGGCVLIKREDLLAANAETEK